MIALTVVALLATTPDVVRVSPGTHEVLKVPGMTKVAVSKPEVADVQVTGQGELLILGHQQGKATLTIWANGKMQNRTIIVDDGHSSEIAKLVKANVNPTLRVEVFNDKTVIDGVVDSVDEMRRLEKLVGDDPNVKNMVRLNPRVLPFIAEQITDALKKNGIQTAHASVVGSKIFLEGSVADQAEMQKAQQIAEAYYSGAGFL